MLLLGVPGEAGDSGELAERSRQAFSYPWGLCPPAETLPSDLSPYSPASPAAELVSHGALSSREPRSSSTERGLCISWFPVQLSAVAPGESLSVSDFNLTGWTLEATCWKDSQVTASSQRIEEHTRGPGESHLTFGIWGCFEEA